MNTYWSPGDELVVKHPAQGLIWVTQLFYKGAEAWVL